MKSANMGRALFTAIVSAMTLVVGQVQADTKLVNGRIDRLSDGDTVVVKPNAGGAPLKIRVLSIDAPEAHLPIPGGMVAQQPWGDQSTKALSKMIQPGSKVTVEDHGFDKYKRTLGRILVNGADVGMELVRVGWAIPYQICEGHACDENWVTNEHVAEYASACEEAREAKKGIFDPANPLKEMPFEFRLRMQKRKADKFVGDYTTNQYYAPDEYRKVDVCNRVFFMKEADAKKANFERARD